MMDREHIGWKRRPDVGDRIRYLGRPVSYRYGAHGMEATVTTGEVGRVIRIIRGYPSHACPDHDEAPECACAGTGEPIPERYAAPVVEYPGGATRCISPEDEDSRWERA